MDGIDLEIARGEFFAFLGPNAAGKTTTIRMLTGLLRPTGGEIRIGGYDMHRESEKAKALLSYVPDFPFLYDKLTAWEFMQFVGDIFRMDRAVVARQSGELFEKFHLTDYYHELTENLSHGTKQRLVIASALLHDPQVFIIDEPMVGLDPMHARIVKQEFRDRSEAGMTMFLSTHQLSVAEEVADRIGIIHHGRLIALGTVDELRRQSGEGGALEKVFLSLIDAEEAHLEKVASKTAKRPN
ncbi:MAG: type transport system ATP-binding protein [Chthoniobacter sp.]|nr:type transport system ATP-binding protein [Chthoniobacter sp.]